MEPKDVDGCDAYEGVFGLCRWWTPSRPGPRSPEPLPACSSAGACWTRATNCIGEGTSTERSGLVFLNVLVAEAAGMGVARPRFIVRHADQTAGTSVKATPYGSQDGQLVWMEDLSFEVKPNADHKLVFWLCDGPESDKAVGSVVADFSQLRQGTPPKDWRLPIEREYGNFNGSMHVYLSLSLGRARPISVELREHGPPLAPGTSHLVPSFVAGLPPASRPPPGHPGSPPAQQTRAPPPGWSPPGRGPPHVFL